ncbi:ABC transporter ATP-binding protein [uncultured Anaerococcus sp.]|uniref:ABC transporter ATP-binding protein n=1 Tax=uncultured Anaerococcus sp. TaxID=293428 RepID=UPI002615C073|nr:ABC transporter ATP-binding protein [uncultured Anaerococcus sp.]
MDKLITINNLKKSYKDTLAIDGLSLELERGKVIGLLGPNGSGKSTLLKLLVGLLKKDEGEILIEGKPVTYKDRAKISYLPDTYYLFDKLRVSEAISMYEDFYKDFDRKRCDRLIDFLKIPRDKSTKDLSKGLRERLLISLTLARNAEIYILDEPVDGVDPVAKQAVIDIIIENMDSDKTFIITTHQIRDMENLFEDVVFLDKGRVLFHRKANEIRADYGLDLADYYKEVFGIL